MTSPTLPLLQPRLYPPQPRPYPYPYPDFTLPLPPYQRRGVHLRQSDALDGVGDDEDARRVDAGEEDGRKGQIPPEQRTLQQFEKVAPLTAAVAAVDAVDVAVHRVDAAVDIDIAADVSVPPAVVGFFQLGNVVFCCDEIKVSESADLLSPEEFRRRRMNRRGGGRSESAQFAERITAPVVRLNVGRLH